MNSEFSFSKTSCHITVKKQSLLEYLPMAEGRMVGFLAFLKVSALCKILPSLECELISPGSFLTLIIIMLQEPPHFNNCRQFPRSLRDPFSTQN